ncbi:hypothetical protein HH110_06995 [Stenotrophomonas sp. SAM-B]|nr:hypothetical protein [Stenotrophomonas sp. SAM-B]
MTGPRLLACSEGARATLLRALTGEVQRRGDLTPSAAASSG